MIFTSTFVTRFFSWETDIQAKAELLNVRQALGMRVEKKPKKQNNFKIKTWTETCVALTSGGTNK